MARPHQTPGKVTQFTDALRSAGAPERYQPPAAVYGGGMRGLEVSLGLACQARCLFCMSGDPTAPEKRFPPLESVRAELDRGRAAGCEAVGLLGGEPTLYPFLGDAIAHARAVGYTRVAIATNALRLADDALARRLAEAGLTRCTISLHSHRANLEDRLTGVAGAFELKTQAVRNLVALRREGLLADNVSINALLLRDTYRHLPEMIRAFRRLGVDDVRLNAARVDGRAVDDPSLVPPYRELTPALLGVVEENERRWHQSLSFGDLPPCALPWPLRANEALRRAYVGEHRDLVTDVSLYSASTQETPGPARFNYQDLKLNDLKVHLPRCAPCRLRGVCEGVWRSYLELHGDGDIRPVRG
ncbi:MAG TPA: radical SAM protein [Polyangia bacterium]|jgi:cyclic pyranopterin phosphate synthase